MTAWVIALLPVIVGVMIVGLQPPRCATRCWAPRSVMS